MIIRIDKTKCAANFLLTIIIRPLPSISPSQSECVHFLQTEFCKCNSACIAFAYSLYQLPDKVYRPVAVEEDERQTAT